MPGSGELTGQADFFVVEVVDQDGLTGLGASVGQVVDPVGKTLPGSESRYFLLQRLPVVRGFPVIDFLVERDKGGVLADETIEKLRAAGIPIIVGGKSNYKTTKKPVRMEYMDDIDLPEFKELPTFKRICICILKNDHTCKYMGFAPNKEEKERRERVMRKYKELL